MFKSYREILSIPGALKFSAAGVLARFPMSLVGISQILMISALYGSYTLAGQVSAVNIVAYAVAAPVLARLVDRYGQSKVMLPSVITSVLGIVGVMVVAFMRGPAILLYIFTIIAGAFSGSLGAMVRSRWTGVVENASQLHTAYSLESTLDEVVFMVGPILATLLTTSVNPIAGLALAVLFALFGGVWFLSQRETEPPALGKDAAADAGGSVMTQPVMISLALVYIGAGAMFGGIDVSVVAFTSEHGVRSASGLLLAVFATGSMLAGLIYGARTWRFPLWKLFVTGVVALSVGVTLVGFTKGVVLMAIMMFITGFGISPTMINVNAMVQRAVPARRLTEGLTCMSTAMNVGVSIGSAIAGRFIDHSGSYGGFHAVIAFAWLMTLVTLLSIPFLRETSRKRKKNHLPTELRSRRLGMGRLWKRKKRRKGDQNNGDTQDK